MMGMAPTARDLRARKSEVLQKLVAARLLRTVLVIDDNPRDAQHIGVLLKLVLGYDLEVHHAASIPRVLAKAGMTPDLIFLDDNLPPLDRAESALRSLRRFGLTAPIVVMSGTISRNRRRELGALELLGILDKEELSSFTIAELLTRLDPA